MAEDSNDLKFVIEKVFGEKPDVVNPAGLKEVLERIVEEHPDVDEYEQVRVGAWFGAGGENIIRPGHSLPMAKKMSPLRVFETKTEFRAYCWPNKTAEAEAVKEDKPLPGPHLYRINKMSPLACYSATSMPVDVFADAIIDELDDVQKIDKHELAVRAAIDVVEGALGDGTELVSKSVIKEMLTTRLLELLDDDDDGDDDDDDDDSETPATIDAPAASP